MEGGDDRTVKQTEWMMQRPDGCKDWTDIKRWRDISEEKRDDDK